MSTDTKKATGIKLVLISGVLLVAALGVGGCVATRPYSEGYRDGYVQKFSRKGMLRKSWEGEMALAGSARMVQSAGNVWPFTVSDTNIVTELQKINAGQLVRLHYDQYLWTFGGETNYRVTKVEILRE